MAFLNLYIQSQTLGMQTHVQVVIPDWVGLQKDGKKMKCLYLLHGLGDDETTWARRTSIERYADRYGVCVVMPRGEKSFYADGKQQEKYYTYVAKELPTIVETLFNVSKNPEDRYIGGNSMGGYGALKIALTEEGRYAAAFGLSSVANIHNKTFTDTLKPVFGGKIPDEADLYKIVDMHKADKIKPRLYMTIGRDDYMYEENIAFQRYMQGKNYDYSFVETEGDHTWNLWDVTVQQTLKWMLIE